MVGDPSPSKGGVDFFQKSLGDPFPNSGELDFFQKSLGDPYPSRPSRSCEHHNKRK